MSLLDSAMGIVMSYSSHVCPCPTDSTGAIADDSQGTGSKIKGADRTPVSRMLKKSTTMLSSIDIAASLKLHHAG